MMTTTADKAPAAVAKVIEKPAPDKRRALGRGLDSLLPTGPRVVPNLTPNSGGAAAAPSASVHSPQMAEGVDVSRPEAARGDAVMQLALDLIDDNPHQTRIEFSEEALHELAESISESGLIQPIVVRPGKEGRYILVLGERRCRASKLAGKTTVPAIVRKVSEQQAAEMTVIENLQRQDLNCMEQATAFAKLSQGFGMTQEQIGKRVGISRESVSNYMRLLKLPSSVVQYLNEGKLGFSEARALLRITDMHTLAKVADEAVQKGLSFAQLDDMIEKINMKLYELPQGDGKKQGNARWVDPNVRAAQTQLERVLGLRVRIADRKGKGKIVIEYSTVDDYDRVVEMLKGKN
jgi:ParB family transcriptional regulator, chromosome partitioning protein